jgi:hypothetical protein
MSVQPIRKNLTPIRDAIDELHANADNISGMVVLVCTNNDEDYDYWIAGTVGVERAVGRLEIIQQALVKRILP